MYEDEAFPERELAALVAAKIYYHLQAYDESMVFALGASKLFDIEQEGEFEETIIAKCIDTYVALSASRSAPKQSDAAGDQSSQLTTSFPSNANGSASTAASLTSPITPFSQSALPSKSLLSREESNDPSAVLSGSGTAPGLQPAQHVSRATEKQLNAVIRRIFERCFHEGAYKHVVGIAVEARELNVLRETFHRAPESSKKGTSREELMEYLLDICMNVIQERGLRNQILQLILDLLVSSELAQPDYFSIAKCIVYLGQHSMAANMLKQLVDQEHSKPLAVAYQISFDLFDNGSQEFLAKVTSELPQLEEEKSEFSGSNGHAAQPNESETAEESDQLLSEVSGRSGPTSTVVSRTKTQPINEEKRKIYTSIRDILSGTKSLELNLEFLFRNIKADRNVLNKLKNSLEARNSIFHSAVMFANTFMHAGTTSDWFIRESLDWLNKAVNWSKFSVTASLGIIHKGNIGQGQKLLDPYLRDSPGGSYSPYSKGGALFALGLIYTNHGKHVVEYLFKQLKDAQSEEVIQHGAALGLGVAGMASGAEHIVDELKTALWSDSAISGQAAGLGMGLVLLGSGNIKALEDMIAYAHETEHDKTVRGIALGMALIMYARQEAADELINGLLDDPNPTLRYGGIMTIALAYCGTSSNKAVRKLLHVAVSDVNDDVRRVAVMSLGFVLFRKPGSVPRMVELLAESYNPHVRYGATMALGIACAGTGLEEAVDLLEPMMKDSVDFVRQGAYISLAMIMVQQSEAMNPKTSSIRKHLQKVISDRHEDAMAKFGGALALGIIDAGGRNCTIGLQTQTGNLNMEAVVGMAIFTQYWYWFPLTHFLALSFTPTSIIAVDSDLETPQVRFHCNARPSLFDYPPSMEVKQEEAPEKVKTAVLSTTAQAKRRKAAKERQSKPDGMDIDQPPATPKTSAANEDKMEMDEDVKDKESEKKEDSGKGKKAEKEKVGFELDNLSRVLPSQLRHISFPEGRYTPVKKVSHPVRWQREKVLTMLFKPTGGVVLLLDKKPSEAKTLVERKVKKSARPAPGGAQAPDSQARDLPQTPANRGVDNVAAILNAVDDDDDEDAAEAETPAEFEYHSDDD